MDIIESDAKNLSQCDHHQRVADVNCVECSIRHRMLFAGVDVEAASLLLKPVKHVWFDPGTVIYRQGDAPRSLFSVRSGIIKLSLVSPEGDMRIVRLMGPGSAVGLEGLLGENLQHQAEILVEADLCVLPVAVVRKLGDEQPLLYKRLMEQWQQQIKQADEFLLKLSTGAMKNRVLSLLQELDRLGRTGDTEFQLPANPDIAALVAARVESVSRIMAEFKREGTLIKTSKGQWKLALPSPD